MKKINFIISRIPILLFLTIVSLDLILTHVSITTDSYKLAYYYMNEVLNAGIVANVFILLAVYRYNLCLYNKVSVFGLIAMNIVNIIFIGDDGTSDFYTFYGYIFTHAIMIPTAILSITLMIKKI